MPFRPWGKSLSRFARNTADCLELVRKLLGLGIPVYFEKENIDTGSMESELILTIMGSLAEGESISFSENSRLGVRYRFENGTDKAGCAPYGYTVTDGEYSINEEEPLLPGVAGSNRRDRRYVTEMEASYSHVTSPRSTKTPIRTSHRGHLNRSLVFR